MANLRLRSITETATLDIPAAGEFLGLNRVAAYRAAKKGFLPVIQVSERRYQVPVAALRGLLGFAAGSPAIEFDTDAPELALAGIPTDRTKKGDPAVGRM